MNLPDNKLYHIVRDAFFGGTELRKQQPITCYIARINLYEQFFEVCDMTAMCKCNFTKDCAIIGQNFIQNLKTGHNEKQMSLDMLIGYQIILTAYDFNPD